MAEAIGSSKIKAPRTTLAAPQITNNHHSVVAGSTGVAADCGVTLITGLPGLPSGALTFPFASRTPPVRQRDDARSCPDGTACLGAIPAEYRSRRARGLAQCYGSGQFLSGLSGLPFRGNSCAGRHDCDSMIASRSLRRVATALLTTTALCAASGCGAQLPALPGVTRPDSTTTAAPRGSVQPTADPTPAPDPRVDLLSRLNIHYPDDIKSDVQALLLSSSIDLRERYPEQDVSSTADQPGSSHTRMVVDLHGYGIEFDTVSFASATEEIVALRGNYLADDGHAGGNWELVPEARQVTLGSLPDKAPAVLGAKADWLDFRGTSSQLLRLTLASAQDSRVEFASTELRDEHGDPTTVIVTASGRIVEATMV
jgi:hypothetical protein